MLTLALDALKGLVPVLAARWAALRFGLGGDAVAWSASLAGLGAFLGHLWPIYFRFAGGKGVATAAGVAARPQSLARPGDARDLAHHRRLLPLFVAGLARRRRVRAVLPAAHLGRRARR